VTVEDDGTAWNATDKVELLMSDYRKLLACLQDNLTAWEGEEDSVKAEHFELIKRTRKVLNGEDQ
jgi:hypothetical protein